MVETGMRHDRRRRHGQDLNPPPQWRRAAEKDEVVTLSRTDVHRPWYVQENDPHARNMLRNPRCQHIQRSDYDRVSRRWLRTYLVPCDLHDGRDVRGPRVDQHCHYNARIRTCGCRSPWCNGTFGRRKANRRERVHWSRALAQPSIDFDDADVRPIRPGW